MKHETHYWDREALRVDVKTLVVVLWVLGGAIACYGLAQLLLSGGDEGYSGIMAGFTIILTVVYIGLHNIEGRQTTLLEQGNRLQQKSISVQEHLAQLQQTMHAFLLDARQPTPILDSAGIERAPSMPGFKIHMMLGNPGDVKVLPRGFTAKLLNEDGGVFTECSEWYALETPQQREALAIGPFDTKPMQFAIHTNEAKHDRWPSCCILTLRFATGSNTREITWKLGVTESTANPKMKNLELYT